MMLLELINTINKFIIISLKCILPNTLSIVRVYLAEIHYYYNK